MTNFNTNGYQFSVCSDWIEMGSHPEDGSDIIGDAYYIRATGPDGSRFTIGWGADSISTEECGEYGDFYVKHTPFDSSEFEAIASALNAGEMTGTEAARRIGDKWERDAAAYGSEAHDERDHMDAEELERCFW